jgi:hypothetical protein
MEHYQAAKVRAGQTVAVINQYLPGLKVGSEGAAALLARAQGLDALAQARDTAQVTADVANNAEHLAYMSLRKMTLSLPQVADAELDDNDPAEAALQDLLDPAFGISPRTVELAQQRGMKLVSALSQINTYLAAQRPPRGPITSGGAGLPQLSAALAAQPNLLQAVEDAAADLTQARTALRVAATGVDRLSKRFYAKLQAEARNDEALSAALAQVDTGSANLPGTLGIRSLLQGGTNGLQLVLSYENATFDDSATNMVEWMVEGGTSSDSSFAHSAPALANGNTLGPFAVGSEVSLRTRVTNANGTTTGSVRKIRILDAAV